MKALLIVVPILLIGGALGAAFMGVITVPGVTPTKKATTKEAPEATETEEASTESTEAAASTTDLSSQSPGEGAGASLAASNDTRLSSNQTDQADPTTQGPTTDPTQGAKTVAKLWDEIDTLKLLPITNDYTETELAQIVFYMNKTKVAKLLAAMRSDRAAKVSRELQRLASIVEEAR